MESTITVPANATIEYPATGVSGTVRARPSSSQLEELVQAYL
jgi:hypothetical protein